MFKALLQPVGDGEAIEVELDRTSRVQFDLHKARVGDATYELELSRLRGGAGWMRIRGVVYPIMARRRGDEIHVWLKGKVYTLERVERTPQRATAAAGPSASGLTAPMPGTILKINAEVGDSFEPHQALIIMESMKMEMTLSVPHAGVVKTIDCNEGQLVAMGAVLMKLGELEAQPE